MSEITSLADITRVHAESQPDKVAMIFEGREWTYGDLDRESNQVATPYWQLVLAPKTVLRTSTKTARSTLVTSLVRERLMQ